MTEADMTITFSPIGVIHSPFLTAAGTPIQPATAAGALGTVEILPHLAGALEGIEGFDRIWLLYQFHQSCGFRPTVVPFLDTQAHGLFATRSPARPNPLGLSVVRLLAVRGNLLEVTDIDVVNGTPLLDIKPYVPRFDSFSPSRAGWMDKADRPETTHADERFVPPTGSQQKCRRKERT